jgi:hypothetical protein
MAKTRIILVGRHSVDRVLPPEFEVVEKVSITWNVENLQALHKQWSDLRAYALQKRARIVLQNMPAILTHAIVAEAKANPKNQLHIGIMVMRTLSPRWANKTIRFDSIKQCWNCGSWNEFVSNLLDVVQFANPRSSVRIAQDDSFVEVTVDPILPIEFVRIDWL